MNYFMSYQKGLARQEYQCLRYRAPNVILLHFRISASSGVLSFLVKPLCAHIGSPTSARDEGVVHVLL